MANTGKTNANTTPWIRRAFRFLGERAFRDGHEVDARAWRFLGLFTPGLRLLEVLHVDSFLGPLLVPYSEI